MGIRVIVKEQGWQDVLQAAWHLIQHDSAHTSVFQTWEWMNLWWKHFGGGKQAQVVCILEGKDIVGIAPLYAQPTPLGKVYRWMGTGISDRLGVLCLPNYERLVAEATVDWLSQRSYVDLHQVPEGNNLQRVAQAAGWLATPQDKCPYVVLPKTWQTYWESLSKKMRFNLGYSQRQLERLWNNWSIHPAHEAELEKAMQALFQLHTRRWRQRAMPGGFFRKTVRHFHLEWAYHAHRKGWLRLYLLQLAGQIQAVMYVFHFKRRAYYYLSGFEPTLARYSLGTILTAQAIRRAIEEGCVVFDFLRGDEPYKYRWKPQILCHWRLATAKAPLANLWKWKVASENWMWQRLQERLHRG